MINLLWLLSLITYITVSHFGTESSPPCPANQFFNDADGVCCEFCPRGTYMFKPCRNPGSNSLCFACQMGKTYMDEQSNMTMCKLCTVCDPETEVEERVCDRENDQQCVCREGFYMKGNECMMDSTAGSETVPTSIKSPPWWFWVLLIVTLLIMLFIFLFVKRWFCPQSGFIHRQQQQQRHGPSLNPVTTAHVFLGKGVGGASIASDRGSAPTRGMEGFLQPMSEGRASHARPSQWEASVPKATTEPLRGAGLRDAFDRNGRSSKRDVNKIDEEPDRHAEDVEINLNEHFLGSDRKSCLREKDAASCLPSLVPLRNDQSYANCQPLKDCCKPL